MKNFIKNLLSEKAKDSQNKVFYTQWQLAEENLPQVLNLISHTFPHYSLHDRSHSDTIINNIGRLIGKETLEKLSAIDLWLILCAAYYHDIGMAVFACDKKDIFQDDGFLGFIKETQFNTQSPLHDYAVFFEIKDKSVFYKNNELNGASYESARFLLAEYIRTSHADRSKELIRSNASLKALGEMIPERIIDLLASICSAHTQSFDKVMELPFSEVGINAEDCHPRYIACLLRLGDLLDMDNNRFSEVLLQTLGSVPIDSIQHRGKHLSIKHIRIDRRRIEAKAICNDYDIADLMNHWFSSIDDELYHQMKRWNDIVPDVAFGFLPTLGDVIVELEDYDTIDGKERPRFKIDPEKSIELLQGAGLYSEPYQSVRELLQNAVDATLLRVFLENEHNPDFNNRKKWLRGEYRKYPICITIKKHEAEEKKISWNISILDNGIGMSKSDIRYLTETGSSDRNIERRKIIDRMPEWMKPSGTFGIGFQSVFLLTDEVLVKTCRLNKEERLKITLLNPTGKRSGGVFIQTKKNEPIRFGTELCFNIKVDRYSDCWSIDSKQLLAGGIVNSFDFVNDDSLDIDIAKILDEIGKFSQACEFPINLIMEEQNCVELVDRDNAFNFYCEEKGMELKNNNCPCSPVVGIYYRNQYVEQTRQLLRFLSFDVNVLAGNARNILTLNRNKIQPHYMRILLEDFRNAVLIYLSKEYEKIERELKPYACMFIEYYASEEQRKSFKALDVESSWGLLRVGVRENRKTLQDILSSPKIILRRGHSKGEKLILEALDDAIVINTTYMCDIVAFIGLKADGYYYSFESYKDDDKQEYEQVVLSKKEPSDIIGDYHIWFKHYLSGCCQSHGRRSLMPCNSNYTVLRLRDDYMPRFGGHDHTFNLLHRKYPKMICPYVRCNNNQDWMARPRRLKLDISEGLLDTVYKNRYDESTTREQIKEEYDTFAKDTEEFVLKVNKDKYPH